jgi:hypothetical protein
MGLPTNTNVAKIECNRSDLCFQWLKLTKELHGLSTAEMQLAAAFLNKLIEFKEKILDEELISEFLMSTKIKNSIRESLNIDKQTTFQNMISSLRKKGFFDDNDKIRKAFIPNIGPSSEFLKVVFILKVNEKNKGVD